MLRLALPRRLFSSTMFVFGQNANNTGHLAGSLDNHLIPTKLEFPSLSKAVIGFSESLLLSSESNLSSFGSSAVIAKNSFDLNDRALGKIKDADVDQNLAIYLKEGGEVLVEIFGELKSIGVNAETKFVACGKSTTFTVTSGPKSDRVFRSKDDPTKLFAFDELNQMLQKSSNRIVKISAADESLAMLLDNGRVLTWGNNNRGVIGKNRSLYFNEFQWENHPVDPLSEAQIDTKAKDFHLSSSVLVVLGENGKAYYCGLDKTFLLTEIELPDGKRASGVGSWENNFSVVDEEGNVYFYKPLGHKNERLRFYGDEKLYKISKDYFEGRRVKSVRGKYTNAVAIAE